MPPCLSRRRAPLQKKQPDCDGLCPLRRIEAKTSKMERRTLGQAAFPRMIPRLLNLHSLTPAMQDRYLRLLDQFDNFVKKTFHLEAVALRRPGQLDVALCELVNQLY